MNNPLPPKTLREIAEEYRREQENLANRREAAKQAEQIKLAREQFERFLIEAPTACQKAAKVGHTNWTFFESIKPHLAAMVQHWTQTDPWAKQNNIKWRIKTESGDHGDSAAPARYEYRLIELSW